MVESQGPNPFREITNNSAKTVQLDLKKEHSHEERRKTRLSKGSEFLNRKSLQEKQKENPFQSKIKPSKVVLISNLEGHFDSAKEVFNLFSTFGNIRKVLLMKNLNKTMIEYYQTESSLLCALNINNLKLLNTELRVNYSKYQTIDLDKNNKNQNSIAFNEVFIPSQEDHRYQIDDVKCNLSTKVTVTGAKLTDQVIDDLIAEHKDFQVISRGKDGLRFDCGSVDKSIAFITKNHGKLSSDFKVSFFK